MILGNLFHNSLEEINKLAKSHDLSLETFRSSFNQLVLKLRDELRSSSSYAYFGDPHSWPEIGGMYSTLTLAVEKEFERISEGYTCDSEVELTSADGLLFGIVDGIFRRSNELRVIDYKFGAIEEDGRLKDSYVDQLQFYSYLSLENFGNFPNSLALIDKQLNWVDVPRSEERANELARQMRAVLAEYNAAVAKGSPVGSFAKPSSASCDGCDAKPVCRAFYEQRNKITLSKYHHLVWGRQLGPLKKGPRGISAIHLEVDSGSISHKRLLVGRLFEARYPHFLDRPGQRLLISNLKHDSEIPSAVAELTPSSRIFILGDDSAK